MSGSWYPERKKRVLRLPLSTVLRKIAALPGAMIRHPGSFWFLSECSPDVFGSGAGS